MNTLQAITKQRVYRLIADQIAEKIRAGDFLPGERFPGERELADQMNVARSTLREALIALEIEGYVEVRVGSGVFVTAPPEGGRYGVARAAGEPNTSVAESLPAAVAASPFELLDTRMLLEPECAALAAQNGTAEQFAAIEAVHATMRPAHSPHACDMSCHRSFHLAIAAACGNAALESVLTHVWDLSAASAVSQRLDQHFVNDAVWQLSVSEHERILAAIQARDPVRARYAMSFHLMAIVSRLSEDVSVVG